MQFFTVKNRDSVVCIIKFVEVCDLRAFSITSKSNFKASIHKLKAGKVLARFCRKIKKDLSISDMSDTNTDRKMLVRSFTRFYEDEWFESSIRALLQYSSHKLYFDKNQEFKNHAQIVLSKDKITRRMFRDTLNLTTVDLLHEIGF